MDDTLNDRLDVAINYLRSIDGTLKQILAARRAGSAASAPAAPEVADDADLDGQYGNPEVKFDPKKWDGESHVGRRLSECSPEYLDAVASLNTFLAERLTAEGDEKKAGYKRKDAARARGWAKRIRAGWRAPHNAGPEW